MTPRHRLPDPWPESTRTPPRHPYGGKHVERDWVNLADWLADRAARGVEVTGSTPNPGAHPRCLSTAPTLPPLPALFTPIDPSLVALRLAAARRNVLDFIGRPSGANILRRDAPVHDARYVRFVNAGSSEVRPAPRFTIRRLPVSAYPPGAGQTWVIRDQKRPHYLGRASSFGDAMHSCVTTLRYDRARYAALVGEWIRP